MIIYRKAFREEFQEVKDLWNVVFNEEPAFLEKFFSTRFDPNHIFAAEDEGKIVSALHPLPASYTKEGVTKPCSFIVGAATLESHRNRGSWASCWSSSAFPIPPITLSRSPVLLREPWVFHRINCKSIYDSVLFGVGCPPRGLCLLGLEQNLYERDIPIRFARPRPIGAGVSHRRI